MAAARKRKVNYAQDNRFAPEALTFREEEMLEFALHGKPLKEIAHQTAAKLRTVEKHFEEIRRKLGVRSRIAAVAKYYQQLLGQKNMIIAALQKENRRLRRQIARRKPPT